MEIIKIGEPIITKTGTVITKYVENGRLYKALDFEKSSNRCAKQKGLVRTIVRYGERNKPESIFDTFERKLNTAATTPTANTILPKPKRGRKVTPKTTETYNKAEKETPKTTGVKNNNSQKLIPISTDSFKKEAAKEMFSQIRKYVKAVGNNGALNKEIKIMSDEGHFDPGSHYYLKKKADVFLNINRDKENNILLNITRKTVDKTDTHTLLEAAINKDGQMIKGRYPYNNLTFERYGSNLRRMKKNNTQYMPISGNDREWEWHNCRLSGSCADGRREATDNNSVGAAFEVFIELARLYTKII